MIQNFTSGKGTYILILRLSEEAAHIITGKLGAFDFPAGYYAYVGSAFGAGGLRGRLKHHLTPVKKPHWHIDYLRQSATICEIWYVASETRHEHQWADMLRVMHGAGVPAPRFGASDCTCESHLIHFSQMPDFGSFCKVAGLTLQRASIGESDVNGRA